MPNNHKPDESTYKSTLIKRKNSLTLSEVSSISSGNHHTTVIKVEPKLSNYEPKLSNYDHQQKFIEELDNVIAGHQPKATKSKTSSPPTPPQRKVSLQTDCQTSSGQRLSCNQLDVKQLNNDTNDDNNTICSDQNSIGSITPTNPVQTETNLYRLSNVPIEDKKSTTASTNPYITGQKQIDDPAATLTRQNSRNAKLSTSLKSVIFPESAMLSHLNTNQLSLTNLSQNNQANKPAPPPPIRRTSSISNPNAITIATLRNAGVSTYEEIKNLTLTNLNRFKKNTTNYATYEDVSRLGMSLATQGTPNQSTSHYATFSPNQNNYNLSNQDIYLASSQYAGMNYNTYSGNRSHHYRISSCTNLINPNLQTQQIYSDVASLDQSEAKNDDKEKINQLRSEYQQAKNLFENLECNQTKAADTYSTTTTNSNSTDFQTYLNQQHQQLETDSGCGSNNSTGGGSQTSTSSITGQLTGHISRSMASVRRDFIKKDFMETLNAKLSSPLIKSSPKFKRRSLSIGHDSEYDYDLNDLNESISSAKTISSNLNAEAKKQTDAGHFSLQQSFMRLVQTNYAKITRSPELTRKFLSGSNNSANSGQMTNSLNQATGNSLMSSSYNSSLSNALFGPNQQSPPTTGNALALAKEVASIAIKKKQNSYPTSCGNYEILPLRDFQQQQQPIKTQSDYIYQSTNANVNHTTTIQVDGGLKSPPSNSIESAPQSKPPTTSQEIYQPVQNLQMKSNVQTNAMKNNQRRCSQPSMGIKVMNRQPAAPNQPQQQLTFSQQPTNPTNQPVNQLDQTQYSPPGADTYQTSFMKNADEKANFLNKLETKLSPTREPNKQIKPKNEFENQVAARVETWLNKSSSPEECRESLLDQIRKGAQLRKVETVNDRSAPKI